MARTFAVTYDYLCPFARIAHETIIEALRDGKDWDVRFVPFSLAEVHAEEGELSVWDRDAGSAGTSGVLAHAWALAVRETAPARFLDFHAALFAARHQDAANINDEAVVRAVAVQIGLDPDTIAAFVGSGEPLAILAQEHTEAAKRWSVFGVPTFIHGDEAVFVRLMSRDVSDLEKVIDMLAWTNVNEFKRTSIPR